MGVGEGHLGLCGRRAKLDACPTASVLTLFQLVQETLINLRQAMENTKIMCAAMLDTKVRRLNDRAKPFFGGWRTWEPQGALIS